MKSKRELIEDMKSLRDKIEKNIEKRIKSIEDKVEMNGYQIRVINEKLRRNKNGEFKEVGTSSSDANGDASMGANI